MYNLVNSSGTSIKEFNEHFVILILAPPVVSLTEIRLQIKYLLSSDCNVLVFFVSCKNWVYFTYLLSKCVRITLGTNVYTNGLNGLRSVRIVVLKEIPLFSKDALN